MRRDQRRESIPNTIEERSSHSSTFPSPMLYTFLSFLFFVSQTSIARGLSLMQRVNVKNFDINSLYGMPFSDCFWARFKKFLRHFLSKNLNLLVQFTFQTYNPNEGNILLHPWFRKYWEKIISTYLPKNISLIQSKK